jgi:hypothetical protein
MFGIYFHSKESITVKRIKLALNTDGFKITKIETNAIVIGPVILKEKEKNTKALEVLALLRGF